MPDFALMRRHAFTVSLIVFGGVLAVAGFVLVLVAHGTLTPWDYAPMLGGLGGGALGVGLRRSKRWMHGDEGGDRPRADRGR